MFGWFRSWKTDAAKLQNGKMTPQQFVNTHEDLVLYYSTPFLENAHGESPNVVQTDNDETVYFPVFTSAAGLKRYMQAIGCEQHVMIKGDLATVLLTFDAIPDLQTWGVVIDPADPLAVAIPPKMRVQPKCLR